MFVLSLTLLATLSDGSRQFDVLDKKINAVKDMMELEIEVIKEMIKQDLAMVTKNLSMSGVSEVHAKHVNINTLQVANNKDEDPKKHIQAAEEVYKVIQRGFISEKMSLRKSIAAIDQSVAHVHGRLNIFSGELTSLQTNFINSLTT
ncbi:hypothetical protein DPMN_118810 [Dreissena polymorpha]|uniref:Uncharacterized protein n=1 Tax=Dreissena polymorpha TaxID=45954 RepID=A0A9D4GNS4_DREPO|nr:hypothetical protein DPMN_118810 [Dreissena polymorpha]